jgi:hypothetical protein
MASLGIAIINSDHMPQIAEQEAAWQQLSDLFAISCDALGIPRPAADEYPTLTIGPIKKELMESSLAVRHVSEDTQSEAYFAIDPNFSARLGHLLDQLTQSSPTES